MQEGAEEVSSALLLGLKDYVIKNGFKKVVVGLSGGIDSALVAVLAVDALGKENVQAVFMPSDYTADQSEQDARKLCANLGVSLANIPIKEVFRSYTETLNPHFMGRKPDVTEENIQSRLRGLTLMALSNKLGALVLSTGNKSELAMGFCTLYGDMAGGFAVIKDVPKTLVYKLARQRNSM